MNLEVELEVATTTKFRRMPRLTDDHLGPASAERRQRHCDRTKGHVLQVQHCGMIKCRECDATWKDEGF